MDTLIAQPLVSVLMPVYNGVQYIVAAVDSVLAQTYTHWELIIADDGSTDGTLALLQGYSDPRIRIIQHAANKGLVDTRNELVDAAQGVYIAMLDSDDIALPTRLEEQVQFMEQHPNVALLGSWVQAIDGNDVLQAIYRYELQGEELKCHLLINNHFTQSSMMLRKSLLPAAVYRAQFTVSEDYDLWVRIAQQHPVGNLQKVLVYYREHGNNISIRKQDEITSCDQAILKEQLSRLLPDIDASSVAAVFALSRNAVAEQDIAGLLSVLTKVLAANAQMALYAQSVLGRYLFHRLWATIKARRLYSKRLYQGLKSSVLWSYQDLSFFEQLKFYWRCRRA